MKVLKVKMHSVGKTRKNHTCNECGEKIVKGSPAVVKVIQYDDSTTTFTYFCSHSCLYDYERSVGVLCPDPIAESLDKRDSERMRWTA